SKFALVSLQFHHGNERQFQMKCKGCTLRITIHRTRTKMIGQGGNISRSTIVSYIDFNDSRVLYDMADYCVLSMDHVGGEVIDHGVALKLEDVPWTSSGLC